MASKDDPCQAVCKFASGSCLTCKRTAKEMVKWWDFTDEQRQAVIADLPKRPPPSLG